jgi:hypothetical protein
VRSYIIRIYREPEKGDRSLLVGVVENTRSEQRGFHGIEELGRILLEQDATEKDVVTSPE